MIPASMTRTGTLVYSAKGTYGTSGWMGRKEMKGVLDLVPDLRKHKGIVLGMLDGESRLYS